MYSSSYINAYNKGLKMTCKDLSSEVVIFVVIVVTILTISTAIQYMSWLTAIPIECIDGELYEVTYEGNIKILDKQYGDICIAEKTK
jgi:hypothetical protein